MSVHGSGTPEGHVTPQGHGDRLSPEQHAARRVELPWGLTWDQIRACIPECDWPLGAFATHKIRGLHHQGRSQVLTIRYQESGRRQRDHTIFLKLIDPLRPETLKYRFLTARHAPIPRLIGTASTSAGEILILEFLPTIGTTPEQADAFLDLIASINATEDPPPSIFTPPQGDPEYDRRIRQALTQLLPGTSQATAWFDAYQRAAARAEQLPLTLNHNELSFQQVGWTAENQNHRSQLVMFDLETMSLRPQYSDIAGMLPWLAAQTARTEQTLFSAYLTALAHRTGRTADRNQAWRSMLIVRVVRTFEGLPWLISMADAPEVEAADAAIIRLSRDLTDCEVMDR